MSAALFVTYDSVLTCTDTSQLSAAESNGTESTSKDPSLAPPSLTPHDTWKRMQSTFAEIIHPTLSASSSAQAVISQQEAIVLPFRIEARTAESDLIRNDIYDDDLEVQPTATIPKGIFTPPPTIDEAKQAHIDITRLLQPRSHGRIMPFTGDDLLRRRLELMQSFLHLYVTHIGLSWLAASEQAADARMHGVAMAKSIRKWTRAFLADRHDLPYNPFGHWTHSMLAKGDLASELGEHLQSVGKLVKALDVVEFLARPDIQEKYGLKSTVSLSTAQTWMHQMQYRWAKDPTGQYVDGHERADVVKYRQTKYLPEIFKHKDRFRVFVDGVEDYDPEATSFEGRRVVLWWHDESTFYANDQRLVRWVHETDTATPKAKGEGISLMVADFVSPDYGWLHSRDGKKSARILFRAGKNRDGYFTHDEVLQQLSTAISILKEDYPDDNHIIILDNAPSHLKRGDQALSARAMSKNPTRPGNPMFGVMVADKTPDGKLQYDPQGKILKKKVQMIGAHFADGRSQSLYFEENHPNAGVFKGMTQILKERGYTDIDNLRAQCPEFKCSPGQTKCCTRRILYNEPDFQDVKTLVETHCEEQGINVIFLPKFHCELNPIEQCWCYAKRLYRKNPPSKSEAELEKNVVNALDGVYLELMRK